jgi:cytochrome c oxidase assembly factor CtaG
VTVRTPPDWTSWNLDPAIIVALVGAAIVYTRLYRRARRSAGPNPGPGHWLAYAAGLAALAVALVSPLDRLADRWLLSAHMLQHVLLTDIAAALLVFGIRAPILPLGLSRRGLRLVAHRGRFGRVLTLATRPWVALPCWALATWIWSIPALFDAAAAHPALHAVEHAILFYTGIALWWVVIDPLPSERRRPHGIRLAYLGFTRAASAAVCIPLTWAPTTFYPLYERAPRAYGLSALADQQMAGASMCLIELLVFGVAFAAVFVSVLGREERAASPAPEGGVLDAPLR